MRYTKGIRKIFECENYNDIRELFQFADKVAATITEHCGIIYIKDMETSKWVRTQLNITDFEC